MNLDLQHTPEQELCYARESLADAYSLGLDKLSNFTARLSDTLPGLISGFRELVKFKETTPLKDITSDQRKFLSLLEDHSYGELRFIKGFVPEGFKGKYLSLLDVLQKSTQNCIGIEEKVLEPYILFLASFAVGSDTIRSMDNQAEKWAAINAAREAANTEYAKMFVGKATRVPYNDLVDRNADWTEIFQLTAKVHGQMTSVNFTSLTGACKKAETYLELIERNIKSGKLQDATPEVCLALSEGAYQIARMIEFISITHFRTLIAFSAIDNTVKEVRRIVEA